MVDVLVSLPDPVDFDAEEYFSMTEEDYAVLLADLERKDIYYDELLAFVVQQSQLKLRTWSDNKDLKRKSQRDRGWLKGRVDRIAKGGKGGANGGRTYKRRMSLEDIKMRTRCRRCKNKGHWFHECPDGQQDFEANWSWSCVLFYFMRIVRTLSLHI